MSLFYICSEINCNRKYKTKNKLMDHFLNIHKIINEEIGEPIEITKENKKNIEKIRNDNKRIEQREAYIKEAEEKKELELIAKREAGDLYKKQQIEKYKLLEEQKIRFLEEQLIIDKANFEKREQSEKKPTCSICFGDDVNAAVVPCGHSTFCHDCISLHYDTSRDKLCPICRTEIMMVVKLYI